MNKIVMKIQSDEDEVSSFIKMKDHLEENELDMIVLCFRNLLEKADYTQDEIDGILKQ
jgi:3-oxoacyl-[acyl-carrier-protein] synthase III